MARTSAVTHRASVRALVVILGAVGLLGETCHLETQPASAPRVMCQTAAVAGGTAGWVDDIVHAGGVFYLGGDFTGLRESDGSGSVARAHLGACDAATGAVVPFAPTTDGRVYVLAVHGEHLYVGGDFTQIDGVAQPYLGRVSLASGALDTTWTPAPNKRVEALLIDAASERVYVGGKLSKMNGASRQRLAAVDLASGALVTAFAPAITYDGPETTGNVTALALDGARLYVGGAFTHLNGAPRSSLGSVDAATGLTTFAFAPALADPNPDFPVVEVERLFVHGGRVYACGDWWITDGIGQSARPDPPDPAGEDQRQAVRLDPDTGHADPSFLPRTDGGVQDCELDPLAGLFYIGGHWDYLDGVAHRKLAAIDLASGAVRATWNTNTNSSRGVDALEAIPGVALAVGGSFSQTGGMARDGFAVYEVLGGSP